MKEIMNKLWRTTKATVADVLWAVGKIIIFPADVVMLIGSVLCVSAEAIRGTLAEHPDPEKLMKEIINY